MLDTMKLAEFKGITDILSESNKTNKMPVILLKILISKTSDSLHTVVRC